MFSLNEIYNEQQIARKDEIEFFWATYSFIMKNWVF